MAAETYDHTFLGDNGGNFITNHWVFCSLVIQAVLSVLFTWGAVFFLKPERSKNRFLWKAHRNRTEVIDNVLYRMPSFLGEGIPCMGKDAERSARRRFSFYKKSQGRKREALDHEDIAAFLKLKEELGLGTLVPMRHIH